MSSQPVPANPVPGADGRHQRGRMSGICLALTALTWAVFGQTLRDSFVNYDDDLYVYNNPMVAGGLTWKGIVWAFTHTHSANWHPLTWLSHMLDCQIYGLHPWGHHLTNVLVHNATVVILFLLLRETTGAVWRSAFVAAVFAVHPLRVESVAWVAERKDVLSGLFFVLTIWAYVRFTRRPGSLARYGLVLAVFALGLMCKPMLVTVPLVLLLLDYWPLRREGSWRRLVLEKLPMLALSAGVGAITLFAQREAIHNIGVFTPSSRLANALVACLVYLRQMVWPAGLAVLYPFRVTPVWEWLTAALALAAISLLVWQKRRTQPWLAVGWGWYLLMLLPVLGILQVGRQAHADRYTYLPHIGLYIAGAWLVAEWRVNRPLLGALMAATVAALAVGGCQQTTYWRDSETLWRRAIACTSDNDVARNNLGAALNARGKSDAAAAEFRAALAINPDNIDALNNTAALCLRQNDPAGAIADCRRALLVKPNFAEAHWNLARALAAVNQKDEALAQFQAAVDFDPANADLQNSLGMALRQQGRVDEAISHYETALELRPDNESLRVNLGNAYMQKGRDDLASAQYQKALELDSADVEVQNKLAWLLATSPNAPVRDGAKAVQWARLANDSTGRRNPLILGTLAAALAEAGQFSDAQQAARQAIALAESAKQTALAQRLTAQAQLYRAGHPYHRP